MSEVFEFGRSLAPYNWMKDFSVGEEDIRRFAAAIGDENPLHHDSEAAKKAGFKGIIAPGVMTAGFISAAIAQEIPGVLVCRIEMAFKTPLYAGSRPSVLCIVSSQKARLAKVAISVMDGSDIVAKGSCLLLLPEG